MAGIDNGFIRQDHEFVMDALDQALVAATGKIGSADTELKQSITAEDYPVPQKTDPAGTMSRGVEDFKVQVIDIYSVAVLKQPVRLRR